MSVHAVPEARGAPDPPRGFQGAFHVDLEHRESAAEVSGPIRLVPAAVAVPAHSDDVALLAEWAARRGVSLVPRGGGTGMPGGNVGMGVAVSFSRLSRLEFLEGSEDVVEAGAGVTGAELDQAARQRGRFFPPLPSSAERCTVGGMVANNAAGVRTFSCGSVRAWVEGMDVVLADGTLARLERGQDSAHARKLLGELRLVPGLLPLVWPAVRKNSSGYALDAFVTRGDLLDLVVGSEGTLGLVTAARLRLARLPEREGVALLSLPKLDDLDEILAAVRDLGTSSCEFFGRRFLEIAGVEAAALAADLGGDAAALLLLGVEGEPGAVAEVLERIERLVRDLGTRFRIGRTPREVAALWGIRHAASPMVAAKAERGLVAMQFIEDAVVPDGRLGRYLAGLEAILHEEGTDAVVFGHAGDGNLHVNPFVDVRKPDWRERVRRILERTALLVASLGGTLSGEHGDGRIRAPFHEEVFGRSAALAFRLVKARLDPGGILNPGVVIAEASHDPLLGLTSRRTRA